MAAKPEYVNAGYWWTGGSLKPTEINTDLFTHLFAASAGVDDKTWEVIVPATSELSTFPSKIKQKNPYVKTLLSISTNPKTFSDMVGQYSRRKAFIDSSIRLAREYQFHGLDLYWVYPSSDSDIPNLRLLLNEWHDTIGSDAQQTGKPQLLFVATAYYSPYPNSLHYPIDDMKKCLDWINVAAYDFYTPQSSATKTGPTAVFSDSKSSCGQYGLDQWINNQQFPSKSIVLVLPFYGWAWKLLDPKKHEIFSPASGPATGQEGISAEGLGSYGTIKSLVGKFSAKEVYDEGYITSYCYYDNVWIGYDNEACVATKISKAKDLNLLGYVAWHVGGDTASSDLATTAWQQWKKLSSP